ncbi:hypothetical protein PAXRUDRAFT_19387 [Paxillus rubicundulus Ve08.2h10]|uniref:Uncharacterized protein n=1 Tax=Paxillus rubicundulus Ve08.2h10 TaxID=930991 RepID=A0A0D0CIJ6_9AGAM|nr:hypothetical protein PAXRUDRAFT_19387 [Paxillus rubicundulus Ve08.2h10]
MGKDFTLESAAIILLHITQIPKLHLIAKEAIHAVAFTLEHVSSSKLATDLQNQLQASLVNSVTKHVIVTLSPHPAQLQKETEVKEVIAQGLLSTSMNCTEEAADRLLNSLEDITRTSSTSSPPQSNPPKSKSMLFTSTSSPLQPPSSLPTLTLTLIHQTPLQSKAPLSPHAPTATH